MVLLVLAEKILNSYFAVIPRRKPVIKENNEIRLIAHRGAHNNRLGIIENTLEAFRLAKNAGCWGIEFDIHATADQILVVNHDPTLSRLWRQNIAIADLRFNELRTLVPQIPSLAEVIGEFGGHMHLFIELKTPLHDEYILYKELQHLKPSNDYHLLTLNSKIYNSLSQFPKRSLLLVAVHNNVKAFCDLSIKNNYGGVMGNFLLLTNYWIHRLKEVNQVIGVGFVNSKNSLYREINRKVKWIFTNKAIAVSYYLRQLYRQ